MTDDAEWDAVFQDGFQAEHLLDPSAEDRVREATLRVVRGRSRRRRALQAASVVLVFVAGTQAGGFWRRPPPAVDRPEHAQGSGENPETRALDAEVRAELTVGAESARLFRRAGDLYLKDADVVGATRCYRASLALDPRGPLSEEETWLLAALREAQGS